nr:hypothetical protein [Helicobacter pylori]
MAKSRSQNAPPFNTNIALILSRQAKAIGDFDFDAAFISKETSDNNIYRRSGGSPSLYSVLPNLALICDRGSKVSPISNVFVTSMLCDLHVNGSGSYAFLLFRLKMSE